jgi:hypothetical protein
LHLGRKIKPETLESCPRVKNNSLANSSWWVQKIYFCTFLTADFNKEEVFFVRGTISTNYYASILRHLKKFPVYFYTNHNVSPLMQYKIDLGEVNSAIEGWDNYRIISRWVFKGGVPFVTKSLEESKEVVKKPFKIPEGPKTPGAIWLLNS